MRGLHLLHPAARNSANNLVELCRLDGLPVLITETLRTVDEQDMLYAQGRTAPGKVVTNCRGSGYQSPHQWGVAFDICRNVRGREYDDSDGFFGNVAEVVRRERFPLTWGGDWKSPDKPHFELSGFMPNSSTKSLIDKYGYPDAFIRTWAMMSADTAARAIGAKVVDDMYADGVITDREYWFNFLTGNTPLNIDYVRTVFERYHGLLEKLLEKRG